MSRATSEIPKQTLCRVLDARGIRAVITGTQSAIRKHLSPSYKPALPTLRCQGWTLHPCPCFATVSLGVEEGKAGGGGGDLLLLVCPHPPAAAIPSRGSCRIQFSTFPKFAEPASLQSPQKCLQQAVDTPLQRSGPSRPCTCTHAPPLGMWGSWVGGAPPRDSTMVPESFLPLHREPPTCMY